MEWVTAAVHGAGYLIRILSPCRVPIYALLRSATSTHPPPPICPDRSAFSTCRANACVFKGRWMFECVLGSAGIIQIGFTTLAARYTAEEGIGDSNDR